MLTESSLFRLSRFMLALAFAASAALAGAPSVAQAMPEAKAKPAGKPAPAGEAATEDAASKAKKAKVARSEKPGEKSAGKPEQLGSYGDWGAYAAQNSRDKTCYALGQPKDRAPKAKLKDTSAYVFISTRPAENIHNEVAINLGYATKDGSAAIADIDGDSYELITKGTNAWVKDQSREREFVGALRGGSKLIVKASSAKGTSTTDSYSLKGLSDALARVIQECK